MPWFKKPRRIDWQPLPTAEGVTGRVAIRRTDDRVEMMLDSVSVPADGHVTIVQIPAQYAPVPTLKEMNQRNGLVATQAGVVRVASAHGAAMRILSAQVGQAYSGHLTWTTDAPIPVGGA